MQSQAEYTCVGAAQLCAFSVEQPLATWVAPEIQREDYTMTALAVIQPFGTLKAMFVGLCNTISTCITAP